ncbi:MAG: hypothetical protein JXN65_04540 [Clostridia bacterium]|nr:hypothetical protein [Clostridia bacterium]
MKKAILILAHNNFKQLNRLIKSLQHEDFDIYIHIDKKAKDFDPETLKDGGAAVILENRVSATLDNWTLIRATMNLINAAFQSETDYGYYLLLSAADYPIKSTTAINEFLDSHYPAPFMDCTPIDKNNWVWPKFNHYRWIEINNWINSYVKVRTIKKLLKVPVRLSERVMDTLGKKPYKNLNISLYGGSAWWVLPDCIIKYIREQYCSNNELIKIFSHTITPEETFFQTMVMNSEYKNEVVVNPAEQQTQNCLTFAYFTDDYTGSGKKPFNGHPYVLKADDYDMLKGMEKRFFARKFDERVDSVILDMIDKDRAEH